MADFTRLISYGKHDVFLAECENPSSLHVAASDAKLAPIACNLSRAGGQGPKAAPPPLRAREQASRGSPSEKRELNDSNSTTDNNGATLPIITISANITSYFIIIMQFSFFRGSYFITLAPDGLIAIIVVIISHHTLLW